MNVSLLLAERAAERPDAAAIIEGSRGRTLTFAGLSIAATTMAEQLRAGGIGKGDGVLVFVPMSATLYIVLTALLRLGAVPMFPDPSSDREQIERCCALEPPVGFIAIPKAHLLRMMIAGLRRIPRKFSTGLPVPGAVSLRASATPGLSQPPEPCSADSPALMTFTSGSTGVPKAALRTHGVLAAQQQALTSALDLVPGDIDLATLPVFVLANLAAGVTTIIPDGDLRRPAAIDPRPVLAQIRAFRPNRAAGSPAFFERLVEGACREGTRLDSLERIFTGGAPVFPGLLDRIAEIAPRARIVAVYGSTEAEPIAHVDRAEISAADRDDMIGGRGLLTGQPVRGIGLAILPDRWGQQVAPMSPTDFRALSLPPGEVGEIVVSGAHVLRGYVHGRGDEETKFRVGDDVWHRTGDAGRLDHVGRLWLLGRCAARVVDDRGAFYPFSVECAAVETLGLRRAAALGFRGRRLLVLEAHDDTRRPDASALSGPLAWANLDDIRFLPRIPVDRRHNAKVDYPALIRLLEGSV